LQVVKNESVYISVENFWEIVDFLGRFLIERMRRLTKWNVSVDKRAKNKTNCSTRRRKKACFLILLCTQHFFF